MPFCPQCKAEYKAGVEICPDCRIELTPELLDEEVELADLVSVYRAPTELLANMVRGVLENNGIPSSIRRNLIPGYDGIRGSWVQSHWGEILVPEDDSKEAEEIIQEYLEGMPYDEEDEDASSSEEA